MAYFPDTITERLHEIGGAETKLLMLYATESDQDGWARGIALSELAERLHQDKGQVCTNRKSLAKNQFIILDGDDVQIIGETRRQLRERLKMQREAKAERCHFDNAHSQNENGVKEALEVRSQNGNAHCQNDNASHCQNDNAYKEYPAININPEKPEREIRARAREPAIIFLPEAEKQIEIYDRYYPDSKLNLSLFQQEQLASMTNLVDCEAAIRHAAGNGISPRSIGRMVNQVYKNREWEGEPHGIFKQKGGVVPVSGKYDHLS
jgi:hypothetical protein